MNQEKNNAKRYEVNDCYSFYCSLQLEENSFRRKTFDDKE